LLHRDALNCHQPVWRQDHIVVGQRHYLALDMRKPSVQGDIFASPRLAEGDHRQFDNVLLEDSKAIIVAGVVDRYHFPPARGCLQSLQSVEHARQSPRTVERCKEDSHVRHDGISFFRYVFV
jgi:hypothetical protein